MGHHVCRFNKIFHLTNVHHNFSVCNSVTVGYSNKIYYCNNKEHGMKCYYYPVASNDVDRLKDFTQKIS